MSARHLDFLISGVGQVLALCDVGFGTVFGWIAGWLAGPLAGWLAGPLAGWSAGWPAGPLAAACFKCSLDVRCHSY